MSESDGIFGPEMVEDLPGPLIMIIDDDHFACQLCLTYLRHHHQAVSFSIADDAVAFSRSHRLGVIFLDIDLGGGLRGEEVLSELRKSELNLKTPVIAVTGFTDEAEKKEILEAGFSGFLPKPFSRDDILHLISELLRDN